MQGQLEEEGCTHQQHRSCKSYCRQDQDKLGSQRHGQDGDLQLNWSILTVIACSPSNELVLQVCQPNGEVIITNDGATILKQMQVAQPAAKMLVELSKAQVGTHNEDKLCIIAHA